MISQIHEELNRVTRLAESAEDEFFDNSHKRDREWWILGHATNLLSQAGAPHPTHAEATEPPEPDFTTFSADGSPFKKIEIAEVLRHERRRHKEMKDAFSSNLTSINGIYPAEDPFRSFRPVLLSKFNKRYGSDCWLLLMHSMMVFEFGGDWRRGWTGQLHHEVDSWHDAESSVTLSDSPYEQIFVLSSGGDELVSIYPAWSVIHRSPLND